LEEDPVWSRVIPWEGSWKAALGKLFPSDWRAAVLGLLMKEFTSEERVAASELEVVAIWKLTMMLPEDTPRIVTWPAST